MDLVLNFNKSLQDRLNEYELVFGTGDNNGSLAYSKIHQQWSIYLELVLDPNGWQAIWKIPRLKCEEFKISFPTIVLVYVQHVDFTDLTALIRILGVQDDEAENNLAKTHYVPLIELWPTKQQDKSIAINLESTANGIDTLRFFYLYIEMPWDVDEDSADWVSEHLMSRLRLYFDLRNGAIPKSTSEYLCSLTYEAKRLDKKREYLQDKIDDQQTDKILEMIIRGIQIQNELNLYENEAFRRVLLKQNLMEKTQKQTDNKVKIYVVFPFGKPDDYLNIFNEVKKITHPNDEVMSVVSTLTEKLNSAERDEILFLGPLTHFIPIEGVLIRNSQICGVGKLDEVKIHSLAENIMLKCIAENVVFENLTIECTNTDTALLIRQGKVTLKNCKLIGSTHSTTTYGILVLDGNSLLLDSCELYGFSKAIVGNNGSKIEIINSVIKGAKTGVTVFDDCLLNIRDSAITECEKYGIILQTTQDLSIADGAGFEALNSVSSIKLENISANKNGKCDGIIKKFTLHAIEDLFADPDLDVTSMEKEN